MLIINLCSYCSLCLDLIPQLQTKMPPLYPPIAPPYFPSLSIYPAICNCLFDCLWTPLDYVLHEGKHFILLVYLQSLAHNKHSVNIYWIKERMSDSKVFFLSTSPGCLYGEWSPDTTVRFTTIISLTLWGKLMLSEKLQLSLNYHFPVITWAITVLKQSICA